MRKSRTPAVQTQQTTPAESPYPPDGDLSDYPPVAPVKAVKKVVTGKLGRNRRGTS